MIFQWDYRGTVHALMLGAVCVGEVELLENGQWQAACFLPNAGRDGGDFCQAFPWPNVAKSTLEIVAAMWVNKAALWRDPFNTGNMLRNDKTDKG